MVVFETKVGCKYFGYGIGEEEFEGFLDRINTEKSLAGYFCSDTGVTTLRRPFSLVQFIFSLKKTATMRRIGRLMEELALFA